MMRDDFIHEALITPHPAIAYGISRNLGEIYPDKAILEGEDCSFDLEEFAAGDQCALCASASLHSRILAAWQGPGKAIQQRGDNAWFKVSWKGHTLDVLLMSWVEGMDKSRKYWILAETRQIAERFFRAVCEWCAEVRGEVLVFDGGGWYKSEELFQSIQGATLDNLVLQGTLKQEIYDDLAHFFASQETYREYGIPWKRGILFIGPPGNGKTHAVKALINAVKQPCLYVKSFQARFQTEHDTVRQVFTRARQTTPCLLILEDLDSLVNSTNRSFLNELDGFAANDGIVTLATTNHPERLDPSILDRPSRFDRKYHFDLPGTDERLAYMCLWNQSLKSALRLADTALPEIVAQTAEFSYAYIKELFLSSTMRWIAVSQPGGMQAIMLDQAAALREQMRSAHEEPADAFEVDE